MRTFIIVILTASIMAGFMEMRTSAKCEAYETTLREKEHKIERALELAETSTINAHQVGQTLQALAARPVTVETIMPNVINVKLEPPMEPLPNIGQPPITGEPENLLMPFPIEEPENLQKEQ